MSAEHLRWSRLTTRVLAPNPGPMSLDGTNTYVVRASGSTVTAVVDPGPDVARHLDAIESYGPVELILLTHHHIDHAESIATLSARTGAVVRAKEPSLCIDAGPLRDGDVISAAGTTIVVVGTPGHTADSVCFQLPDDGPVNSVEPSGSILTGDTILGRGTTVLSQPQHAVRDYLHTLQKLHHLAKARVVLPAHGPALPDLSAVTVEYLNHRWERLAQVDAALVRFAIPASTEPAVIALVTDVVYPHALGDVRLAAEASTAAQLAYLAESGRPRTSRRSTS
mgnify:CR=1 FL=1